MQSARTLEPGDHEVAGTILVQGAAPDGGVIPVPSAFLDVRWATVSGLDLGLRYEFQTPISVMARVRLYDTGGSFALAFAPRFGVYAPGLAWPTGVELYLPVLLSFFFDGGLEITATAQSLVGAYKRWPSSGFVPTSGLGGSLGVRIPVGRHRLVLELTTLAPLGQGFPTWSGGDIIVEQQSQRALVQVGVGFSVN